MSKSIEYYMNLPYRVEVIPEENGSGYTATIPDLPGCITSADNHEDLWGAINEAKTLWLEVAIEDGEHVPEPTPIDEETYSGRFVARLPRSLHRELVVRAKQENTSLNQLIVMMLSDGMGRWHESREQLSAYSRLFAKYQESSFQQLSNIYTLVIRALSETPKDKHEYSWPSQTEDWNVGVGLHTS